MDVRFINPFVSAVQNVLGMMCGAEVQVGKPFLKKDGNPHMQVSGVIGFSGDAAGMIVVDFSNEVASKLASALAGIEIDPSHDDFADAIGEIVNMIAGNAKKEFAEGLTINISLPQVLMGTDLKVAASKTTPNIVIPCETTFGPFFMEIGMVMTRQTAHPSHAATAGA